MKTDTKRADAGARRSGGGRSWSLPGRALPALLLGLSCLSWGCSPVDASGEATPGEELVVSRGTFQTRHLLTGELRAAEAVNLVVPRTPGFQVQIRWMEEDGAEVEAGQRVVEFENSNVTSDLEDKRSSLAERETDLERTRAEAASAIADKEFQLEQKRAELEKARIEASVPQELLPARDYQERQLALRRAEVEVTKAEEELEATRQARRAEIEMSRLELEEARREIEEAESAIEKLALDAPTSGVLVIEEHPWEGRKFQLGDSVYPGLTVARIPDLSTLQVEAVLHDVDEGRIVPGLRARATPDAFPDLTLPGEVIEVSPVAREIANSSLRRYFLVRVALAGVDPERLRPGMSVKVEVFDEPREAALLVPRRALDLTAEPPRAHLLDGGTREVELGPCSSSHCVVESGLSAGERLAPRRSRVGDHVS